MKTRSRATVAVWPLGVLSPPSAIGFNPITRDCSPMAIQTAADARADHLRQALESLSGDLLLSVSNPSDFTGLLSVLPELSRSGTARAVVDPETGTQVRRTFVLASRTAELVDDGALEVRVEESRSVSTLFVGEERVRGVAAFDDRLVTTLSADVDRAFVEEARSAYLTRWEALEDLRLRTPPYAHILETIESALGERVRADVEAVFEHAAATGIDVDPVQVCLLMGARNDVQFYELGLWGESEGLASRAKFSREKQQLESAGLVDTEKIPADVGRPRQRLVLPDSYADHDPIELTSEALAE